MTSAPSLLSKSSPRCFCSRRVVGSGEGYPTLCTLDVAYAQLFEGPQGDEMLDQTVSIGYFETLQARVMEGRYFTESDDALHPLVAIINRTMARTEFPGEDPVGRHIIRQYEPSHPIEIIGVVDVR